MTRDRNNGALHAIRDAGRSVVDYKGAKIDDLKERIAGRPYWQEKPIMLNRSLKFIERYGDDPITSVDGLDPEIVLPDELVSKAVRHDGDPIVVIGRVKSSVELPGDIVTYATEEVTIGGKNSKTSMILGVGGGATDVEDGPNKIAMARGVLVAYGRLKVANDPVGPPTAYFVALDGITVDENDPRVRPYLRDLGVKLPKRTSATSSSGATPPIGLFP